MKRIVQTVLLFLAFSSAYAQGFRTPTLTGNAFTDFNSNERVFFGGGGNYNLTWDATNLYVGVGGLGTYIKNEPTILYMDTDPAATAATGTGSLTGFNSYDGRIGTLPFTANFVLYLKNGYAEVRLNTAGTWGASTALTGNIVTGGNDIEISIPWSSFPGGTRPLSFRSLFFKENGSTGTDAYNIMPGDAYNSNINTTPFAANGYFTSWNTNNAGMTNTLTAICAPPTLTLASDVTIDFNEYRGAGFSTTPLASLGQLCTNTWATTGWSDGAKAFGGTTSIATSGDHARGVRNAAVITGGHYGGNRGAGDYAMWIQPAGSDFAPGTLTLKVQNTTGSVLNAYQVMYDVLEFNDQARSNSFNFSYSTDGVAFTPVTSLDHTTGLAASASPAIAVFPKSAVVSGINVPNNGFFYLRWSSNDVAGAGSRDEFGLDNLIIKKLTSFPYCLPSGASCAGSNFLKGVELLNGTTSILNNQSNTCSNGGYTFYNALPIPNLGKGSSYNYDITGFAPGDFGNYAIWIDYNQDGDFDDAGEMVASSLTNTATASNTGSFLVPVASLVGNTRMRVAFTNINVGSVVLTPCNTGQGGEYEDYIINIQACTLPITPLCKNQTITMNTASVTIAAADLDNGSTGCVPLTFSTTNNTFTCSDIGTKTLVLTVTDVNGATATCNATITIKDGAACGGTANIADPCSCRAASTNAKNGQFNEKVEITAFAGQTWRIQSVSGLYKTTSAAPPTAPIPYIVGELIPFNATTSKYELEGVHVDSIGYSLVAERVDALGTVLQSLPISNKCYYPTPVLTAPPSTVPFSNCVITLAAIEKNGGIGNATFKVDGVPATTFNPGTLGQGTHNVEITFNAGTSNGVNPPLSDPACIETITKTITVGAPIITTLACSDNLTFSLNPATCNLTLSPNQLIQGGVDCVTDYAVTVMNGTNLIAQPLTISNLNKTYSYKVTALNGNSCWGTFKVEDKLAPTFNNCPATVDKFCEDLSGLYLNTNGEQLASNAILVASGNVSVQECNGYTTTYNDQVQTLPCANPLAMVITRNIKAVDNSGNTATCAVTINLKRRLLSEIAIPANTSVACSSVSGGTVSPAVSGAPYISSPGNTIFPTNKTACDFSVTYTDQTSPTCGSNFQISRTWVIIDNCTNEVRSAIQVIMVEDKTAPTFTNCDNKDVEIVTNGDNCDADYFTPVLPKATDNCDNAPKVTVKIVNASNNTIANGNVMSNLPIGIHTIVYTATDACGNTTICTRRLIIEDKIAPVAVCDLNTKVSLTQSGTGILLAENVNDGSLDNCCLDINRFEIKRAADSDATYKKEITFNCNDQSVMVALRVWDCYMNSNVCMVNVIVEDKLPPVAFGRDTVVCCANTPIAAAWLNANPLKEKILIDYPSATNPGYFDNCTAIATPAISGSIDNCGNGTVKHTWTVKDAAGFTATTEVRYISEGRSAYTVTFPADVTLTCNNNKQYATDPATAGKPDIKNLGETCPLVGVEYTDEVFKVVPDACFKIVRKWKVLNWCQPLSQAADKAEKGDVRKTGAACAVQDRTFTNIYEQRPDGSSVYAPTAPCFAMMNAIKAGEGCYKYDTDGYMEYTQIIKVIDLTPPSLTAGKVSVAAVGKECKTALTIEKPTSSDCTGATVDSYDIINKANNTVIATGKTFPATRDFVASEFGDYIVRFKTTDQCGNYATTDVSVTIKDIKKPTPVCHNWITTELMATKMVMLDAKVLDAGSYDNCTAANKLKFKIQVPAPDPNNLTGINPDTMLTTHTFVCPPAGTVPDPSTPNAYIITVALWVGDEAGNWDYCETAVTVQDNMDICGYSPIQMKPVDGEVMTEDKKEVESVMVKLDGLKKAQILTTSKGQFKFSDLPILGNYTITPEKDVNPLNGVSTLDLVMISKHILSVQSLSSPYKMIAADVNKNGTISTADLVELRKMILAIQNTFSKNTSWRFVPSDYVFPNPNNPWATTFPETKDFKGLSTNAQANFVAIKIGDVSGNATASGLANGRNDKGTFQLNTLEKTFQTGEEVKVQFEANQLNAFLGYQMTIAYDAKTLELIDIQGDTENFGTPETGFITTSQINNASNTPYTLVFRAKNSGQLSQAVSVNSRYTSAEAYDQSGAIYNVALNFKGTQNDVLALYQNRPNPFGDNTIIAFNMPTAENARLVITDVNGRVVKTIEKDFAKGYNEININKNVLGASGIYYYRLETASQSISKKMILMD